jgi:hypothetical protein
MPKLVYLDSSDFSVLSAPDNELTDENREVLSVLRQHKQAGTATFFMSAIHFSECVHSAIEHKGLAVRRAQLMTELCDGNVLRYPTEIARLELRHVLQSAITGRLSPEELTSKSGEWFGLDGDLQIFSDTRRDLNNEIDGLIVKLPRHDRRKLTSELNLQKRSSHAKWRELIRAATSPAVVGFPLSLLDQNILVDWFLGKVSDSDLHATLSKVMSNPHAMFGYFLDEMGHRKRLYEILRENGRQLARDIERTLEAVFPILILVANSSVHIDLTKEILDTCSQPGFLRRVVAKYSDLSSDHVPDDNLGRVIKLCPALWSFVEVSKAYLISSATAHVMRIRSGNLAIRSIPESDFSDLMHSFYAPYFDVFRCDARFGALLKQQKPIRANIADRIGQLLQMLPESTAGEVGRAVDN